MALPQQLASLPPTPGVYLFKDTAGAILYVGKAKVLRHRVRSYFRAHANLDRAKQRMVRHITSLQTITTDTEHEALVLEANLIQQHQPPYNVILRDDKYYLFIKITKEDRPRVLLVRRLQPDKARYFGPYSSARAARATLRLLQRLFPHHGLEQKNTWVFAHPLFSHSSSLRKTPLDHQVYQENIHNIIRFLQGDRQAIIATLRAGMKTAAQAKAYERAALFRDQLQAVQRLDEQQKVYLPHDIALDVISLAQDPTKSAVNVFAIRHGKMLSKNTFILNHRADAQPADVIRQFILQYYRVAQNIPPRILIPLALEDQALLGQWINPAHPLTFIVPQRGFKKELIRLGELNARQLLQEQAVTAQTSQQLAKALTDLAEALQLPRSQLARIETYDISNIQGTLATGSMVVFEDGQARPRLYKRFRIRLNDQPNDFAMLQEVLSRRFSGHHKDWPLPGLVLVDGGKGQLSAAQKIVQAYQLSVPIAAIAKNYEEIFVPHQSQSIRLPYDSAALFLVQRMRDEAHRFTVSYHRALRQQKQKQSLLDEIPGLGPKTKLKLLKRFGSLKAMRAAGDEELRQVIGSKVKILRQYI